MREHGRDAGADPFAFHDRRVPHAHARHIGDGVERAGAKNTRCNAQIARSHWRSRLRGRGQDHRRNGQHANRSEAPDDPCEGEGAQHAGARNVLAPLPPRQRSERSLSPDAGAEREVRAAPVPIARRRNPTRMCAGKRAPCASGVFPSRRARRAAWVAAVLTAMSTGVLVPSDIRRLERCDRPAKHFRARLEWGACGRAWRHGHGRGRRSPRTHSTLASAAAVHRIKRRRRVKCDWGILHRRALRGVPVGCILR